MPTKLSVDGYYGMTAATRVEEFLFIYDKQNLQSRNAGCRQKLCKIKT